MAALADIDVLVNERSEPIVLEMKDRPSMCVTEDAEDAESDLKFRAVFDALNIGEDSGGWEAQTVVHRVLRRN
jgi:hypothetical protein